MIRSVVLGLAFSLAAAPPLLAQSAQASGTDAGRQGMSSEDRKFLNYAAEDNQAEIALCILAEKKASSPAVKAFARLMVDDHVEIESRLAAVSNAEKADLPDGLGNEGEQTKAKLEPLTGKNFETEFMRAQIEDHGNDLKRFSQEESSTKNDSLHQYAAATRPILDQHLELAKAVQEALAGGH